LSSLLLLLSQTLRKFEIDGSSLVMLSVDQMTNILGMRAEVAQALRFAVDRAMSSMPPAGGMFFPLPSVSSAAFGLAGTFGGNTSA
jgi:Na+-transporting NADH:ubiquinone oxidoreductase subunit NqrE